MTKEELISIDIPSNLYPVIKEGIYNLPYKVALELLALVPAIPEEEPPEAYPVELSVEQWDLIGRAIGQTVIPFTYIHIQNTYNFLRAEIAAERTPPVVEDPVLSDEDIPAGTV